MIWAFAALCAFYVKGLCGFANTLVFTSILGFGSSNISITPVDLLLGCPTNALMAYRARRSIDLKLCLPLTVMVLAGCIPGMFLLKNADSHLVKASFGVITMLLGVEMLLREKKTIQRKQAGWMLGLVGLLSGLLCGLYGVGALLGAYVSRTTMDMDAFKANLCFVFLAENVFRIAAYAVMGILDLQVLLRAAMLFPAMLLGLYAGIRSARRLNERSARRIVMVMQIVSGAALAINAF